MARIFVSAEVAEEIVEILGMLDNDCQEVYVLAPEHIWYSIPPSNRPANVRYIPVRHAPFGDRKAKLVALMQFLWIIVRYRPTVLVSGFSMLKHRIASRLLRIHHIAYLRGLMFDPSVRSGFSDQFNLNIVARFAAKDLLNTYFANTIITVARMNVDFLIARGIRRESIHLCGPVWLQGGTNRKPGARRVIVATSALAYHGHATSHDAQVQQIGDAISSASWPIVLRVHPRDFYEYEQDSRFDDATIDRSSPYDFINSLRADDVLVTPASTLLFEANWVGVATILYTIDVDIESHSAHDPNGVDVYSLSEALTEAFRYSAEIEPLQGGFAEIDTSILRRVLEPQ